MRKLAQWGMRLLSVWRSNWKPIGVLMGIGIPVVLYVADKTQSH
jgi:hypothetical protein